MGDTEDNSSTSMLINLLDNIAMPLHWPGHQCLLAVIAFIFGVIWITDSQSSLDLLIVATNLLLAFALTLSEVSAVWNVGHTHALALFMGIQVAVLCAWATYKGIEGVRLVYVVLLVAAVAMGVHAVLVFVGVHQLQDQTWTRDCSFGLHSGCTRSCTWTSSQ